MKPWELLALEVRALPYRRVAVYRPDNKHNHCRTGEDSECEVEKKLLSRQCQKGIGKFLAVQTQTCLTLIPFENVTRLPLPF